MTQTSPSDLVRSKFSASEIQSRALSFVPDDVLLNIPETTSPYSLFQGFQVTVPEHHNHRNKHRYHHHHHQRRRLLKNGDEGEQEAPPESPGDLKHEREKLSRRLQTMGIRKNMCSSEIHDIDNKIANLHGMRKIVLDRLAELELDEVGLERDLTDLDNRLEDMDEQPEVSTPKSSDVNDGSIASESAGMEFMSESIYQKLPSPSSPKQFRQKAIRNPPPSAPFPET